MGLFDLFKKKRKSDDIVITEAGAQSESSERPVDVSNNDSLAILLEQLPSSYSLDENSLTEITDPHVLARIDNLVPSISTTGTSIGSVVKNIQSSQGEALYKVVLQKGGKLVDSRTMAGAKRAMTVGPNGIRENANLIEVKQCVDKSAVISNAGQAAMGIA